MDRNVYAMPGAAVPEATAPLAPSAVTPPEQPKPAEKLLKYFPAEALALYAALDPALNTASDAMSRNMLTGLLFAALAVSIIFCAMFLKRFWAITSNRQIAISCVALVAYVTAVGGPFARLDWYHPVMGLIASILISAFIIFAKAPTAPDGRVR